jgi:AcrR family transcriptional regulator
MARKPDPNRLEDLAQAGFRVFAEKGFRRTQMADVAAQLGVSAGSLYTYVASKQALFLLVLARQNQDHPLTLPAELPLQAPSDDAFLLEIRRALTERVHMGALYLAPASPGPPDPAAEFEAVVRSIYQSLYEGRGVLILLERCGADWPELSAQYGGSKSRYIKRLKAYLEARAASGALHVGPSAHASARFIAETCTWFAMRRPALPRSGGIDDGTAERTVVELLCRAFVPAASAASSLTQASRGSRSPRRGPQPRRTHV